MVDDFICVINLSVDSVLWVAFSVALGVRWWQERVIPWVLWPVAIVFPPLVYVCIITSRRGFGALEAHRLFHSPHPSFHETPVSSAIFFLSSPYQRALGDGLPFGFTFLT